MNSYVIRILKGGRITIPVALRREMDIRPGDQVDFRTENGELFLTFRRIEKHRHSRKRSLGLLSLKLQKI